MVKPRAAFLPAAAPRAPLPRTAPHSPELRGRPRTRGEGHRRSGLREGNGERFPPTPREPFFFLIFRR